MTETFWQSALATGRRCWRSSAPRRLACWAEPFVHLRVPHFFNLRRDPFERAYENSNTYWDWLLSHAFLLYGMQAIVAGQIEGFVKYPPRQKPASFNLDGVHGEPAGRGGGKPLDRGDARFTCRFPRRTMSPPGKPVFRA